MKKALEEILTIFILIYILFQPILNEVYALRSYTVEMILDSAIEEAANGENGRFTPEIINKMKNTLVAELGYEDSEIQFRGTTTLTDRGQYIEASLSVPHKRLWILPNFFDNDSYNDRIEKYAKQMSEYIIR
ncbi:hypothetical protein [Brevibacillus sp. 179-C9.3 HS]|uniref:hypothetical protein n=1 Tax=unclassified Brevibacillus TaxID=2684853 RepID=UPI0039A31840